MEDGGYDGGSARETALRYIKLENKDEMFLSSIPCCPRRKKMQKKIKRFVKTLSMGPFIPRKLKKRRLARKMRRGVTKPIVKLAKMTSNLTNTQKPMLPEQTNDEEFLPLEQEIYEQEEKKVENDDHSKILLYFLLIGLVALVIFCGKAFAITFTTAFLLLVPQRRQVVLDQDWTYNEADAENKLDLDEGTLGLDILS